MHILPGVCPDAGTESKATIKKPEISKWYAKRMVATGCWGSHKSFGSGTAQEVAGRRIKVKFDNGKRTILGLDLCEKNGLLVRENV